MTRSSDLRHRLAWEAFPRAAAYDPEWALENLMGPNVLWLAEALAERLHLAPGMRILDLGCGTALSSIFLAREFNVGGLPAHLQPYRQPEFWSFHSPAWWRTHWERSGLVDIDTADVVPDGWRQWLDWLEVCGDYGYPTDDAQAEMLRLDAGHTLGFSRIVARRRTPPCPVPG